jgi:hypothetical protein
VRRQILIRPIARPPVRAQEFCAFLLTLTYIDVGHSEVTQFWCYLRSRLAVIPPNRTPALAYIRTGFTGLIFIHTVATDRMK